MADDQSNGNSTLPAPHPATPEWARSLFDALAGMHNELKMARRREESRLTSLVADVADHEFRLTRLESGYTGDEPTNPGRG